MPINKREGESKDDFISRCMSEEVGSGKEQGQSYAICISKWESFAGETASVTDNTWSTEAPINVNLEEGIPHYTADGKLYTGPTHKDASGRLMTGVEHTEDSEYLYHEDELKSIVKLDSYTDYPDDVKSNAKNVLDFTEENGWGSCGTPVGKQRANQLANGEPISLDTIKRMYNYLNRHSGDLDTSTSYSDGCGKLMYDAWGGKSALSWSRNKLKELGELGEQTKLSKVKRVLFNEDFNEEEVREWKDLGYKVSILSKRKIKRQDKKVWNRLKSVGLSERDLVFGSIKEVDKRWNFDVLLTGQDPFLEKFMTMGEDFNPKKVLSSQVVESMEEAEKTQEMLLKSVQMRFVTVKVVYTYEEIPGIPAAQSGSRPFCTKMMSSNKQYSLDEIRQLSNRHLIELGYGSKYAGLQPDVFQWRGGFYRKPGTLETTAYCRHQWRVNVVMG